MVRCGNKFQNKLFMAPISSEFDRKETQVKEQKNEKKNKQTKNTLHSCGVE